MAEHVVSAPLHESETLSSEELPLTSGRQVQREEDAGGLRVISGVSCTSTFRSRAPRRGGMSMRLVLRPPFQRIGIYQAPPALSVEGRPMAFRLKFLVPVSDGISLTDPKLRERLWDKYFTAAPRPRTPSELQYSDRRLRPRR